MSGSTEYGGVDRHRPPAAFTRTPLRWNNQAVSSVWPRYLAGVGASMTEASSRVRGRRHPATNPTHLLSPARVLGR